jgi:hypothetical protein
MGTYFSARRPNRGVVILAVCVFLVAVFAVSRDAIAANRDCGAILHGGASTGETPQIIIDAKRGTVHVTTSEGRCSQGPASRISRQSPSRRKLKLSPPPLPAATPRAGVGGHRATRRACDKSVGDLWASGLHEIGGVSYWLRQVHTVDLGGDGRIDNVGFRLRPVEGDDLVLSYFATTGQMSVKSAPQLVLSDNSMIGRLCFGQTTFEMPKVLLAELEPKTPFKVPDIALELTQKKNHRPGDDADAESSIGIWMGIASGTPIGLMIGGIGAYLVRRKQRSKADGEDDGEEDDADPWA